MPNAIALGRRDVAKAFPGRQVVGHDDLLQVLVGEFIEICLAWQPSAQAAIGVLDPALLPGGVGIAEPCRHLQRLAQQGVAGERGVVVEGDRLAQNGVEAAEDRHDHRCRLGGALAGQACGERQPGLALVQHQHRAGPLADHQIALPVAYLGPVIDVFRPLMDGNSVLDRVAGPPGRGFTPALVAAGQEAPELLGLLAGAIQEGVDRLHSDGAQPQLRT